MQDASTPVDQPIKEKKPSLMKRIGPTVVWTGLIGGSVVYTVGVSAHQFRIAKMALETAKINHATALLKKQ